MPSPSNRSAKPRNRPSFRQILMHLEIASSELLSYSPEKFVHSQAIWREEIQESFQKMKAEGSNLPQLEEELIKRRKEELRHAQDVREHYERKLERANNLYMELTACMLQLEKRERELIKREQQLMLYNKRRKSIVRPIIKAQEKLDRMTKKRTHKSGSDITTPDSMKNTEFSSMTTSSELVLPSPNKMRSRKSRHRRNNSRGSAKDIISPLKSPSREAFLDGEDVDYQNIECLQHIEHGHHISHPGTFKFLGPGTAIREQQGEDEEENTPGKCQPDGVNSKHYSCQTNGCLVPECSPALRCPDCSINDNIYDNCFKCDGGCNGAAYNSKRSSQISADVESTCDSSPLPSPRQPLIETMIEKSSPEGDVSFRQDTGSGSCSCSPMASPADCQSTNQPNPIREKDSNENLHCPIITSDNRDTSNVTISLLQGQTTTNIDYCTASNTISDGSCENNANPRPNNQLSLLNPLRPGVNRANSRHAETGAQREHAEGTVHNSATKFRKPDHSEDSWSEEGELSDDEESLQQPPCRQSYSAQSSEGVFSEEDTTSDQSGHKDGSGDGDNGHLSTGSTENLEAELSKCTCTSDGLSDRELTVQRMKNKVNSTDRIFENSDTETSLDSDECSDITVSTAVFMTRSLESSTHW
ncbi:hypothetical protein BsWGS_18723 [Bradybaena similaris]